MFFHLFAIIILVSLVIICGWSLFITERTYDMRLQMLERAKKKLYDAHDMPSMDEAISISHAVLNEMKRVDWDTHFKLAFSFGDPRKLYHPVIWRLMEWPDV